MKKIINIVFFCLLATISIATVDYGKYFGTFDFEFNKDNFPYAEIENVVSNIANLSTPILVLNENYYEYFSTNSSVDYFSLGVTDKGIQLGLQIQALWEVSSEKILLLEGSEKLVGKVLLDDTNTNDGNYIGYFDIYFIIPTYNTSFSYDNNIVFDFTPVYSGDQIWWIVEATTAVFSSTNLPPITLEVGLEIFEEYEFLSDELKLTGTQDVYFSNDTVSFEVKVGTNLGNHYNSYGDTLQIMYFNEGCPEERLYVADAVVSIPMEGGYYRYYTIPVYYKIPAPTIDITVGGSFYLTFDPANPENNYKPAAVPVTIESTVPSYLVNLSLEIFEDYDFLEGYIELSNGEEILVNAGNYEFDLQLKANFADLWNEERELFLSHFADDLLNVNENMYIGNVYITVTASPTN